MVSWNVKKGVAMEGCVDKKINKYHCGGPLRRVTWSLEFMLFGRLIEELFFVRLERGEAAY